jgi:hypothetical protein
MQARPCEAVNDGVWFGYSKLREHILRLFFAGSNQLELLTRVRWVGCGHALLVQIRKYAVMSYIAGKPYS